MRTSTASTSSPRWPPSTKALQSVALGLLEEHLSHCVAQAMTEGGDGAADKVREAADAIARLVRS